MNAKKKFCLMIATAAFIILLCALAVSCEKRPAAVPPAPTGLQIENDILTWQEDEKATGYLVSVDGKEYQAKGSGFDLFLRLLQSKTYELRVRALYDTIGAADSDWSEPVTYTVEAVEFCRIRLINDDTEYEIAAVNPEQIRGKLCLPSHAQDQKPITQIADSAFENCTGLTGVIIPDTVKTIGNKAFSGCTNLRRVRNSTVCETIGGYAFSNCVALTGIHLPGGIDTIGSFAFFNCAALSDITLPTALTKLNAATFRACSSLEKIYIPEYVESIGIQAFGLCDRLTSITVAENNPVFWSKDNCVMRRSDNELVLGIGTGIIPSEVRSIGSYAFAECSGLSEITVPGTVEIIGPEAFACCHNLTAVTLEEGIRSIGIGKAKYGAAFWDCPRLTHLEIPATVENIGLGMTRYCKGLTSLTVREGNATYRSEGNCIIRRADDVLVMGCPASVIPEGIREIMEEAFEACALKDVVIPEGVEVIGASAFAENELTSLKLPRTLRKIGDGAFLKNASLTIIVIPNGVQEIGAKAFNECGVLAVFLPGSVETIGAGAFDGGAFDGGATVYTSASRDFPAGWHRANYSNPMDSNWAKGNIIFDCSLGDDDGYPYVASLIWLYEETYEEDAYGSSYSCTSNIPTLTRGIRVPYRDGYTFMGWTTEASGNTVQYGKTTYEGDDGTYEQTLPAKELKGLPSGTVLYAVWAPSEAGVVHGRA